MWCSPKKGIRVTNSTREIFRKKCFELIRVIVNLGCAAVLLALGGSQQVAQAADPPDILFPSCLDPADRAERAALRTTCDDEAEDVCFCPLSGMYVSCSTTECVDQTQAYQHGVFRPLNPSDDVSQVKLPICTDEEVIYLCIGAPPRNR